MFRFDFPLFRFRLLVSVVLGHGACGIGMKVRMVDATSAAGSPSSFYLPNYATPARYNSPGVEVLLAQDLF